MWVVYILAERGMVEAAVPNAVQILGGFIVQEGWFLCRISDKVKISQNQLQLLRGFLGEADARQQNEETVRIWVAEIRNAAYGLEEMSQISTSYLIMIWSWY